MSTASQVTTSPGTWLAVPGAALRSWGSSSSRYRPSGCSRPASAVSARSAARRSAASRSGRAGLGLALRPALEQAAEGEARDLARGQANGRGASPVASLHAVGAHQLPPAVAVRLDHLPNYYTNFGTEHVPFRGWRPTTASATCRSRSSRTGSNRSRCRRRTTLRGSRP